MDQAPRERIARRCGVMRHRATSANPPRIDLANILSSRQGGPCQHWYVPDLPNGIGYQPEAGHYTVRLCAFDFSNASSTVDLRFVSVPGKPRGRYQMNVGSTIFVEFLRSLMNSGQYCQDQTDLEQLDLVVAFGSGRPVGDHFTADISRLAVVPVQNGK